MLLGARKEPGVLPLEVFGAGPSYRPGHSNSICFNCVACSLLREFTERDHVLNGPDEEDGIFSENPQSDFLHEVETTQWVRERLRYHRG